ncbi:MAG: hypothetical protein WD448_02815, partial [Woeseia sp.]
VTAMCAADTAGLVNDRDDSRTCCFARRGCGSERQHLPAEQVRQAMYRSVAAWGAEIYSGPLIDNGGRVRAASGVAALGALGLR